MPIPSQKVYKGDLRKELSAFARGGRFSKGDDYFVALANTCQLRCGSTVGCDLEETHASENADHFSRSALGIGTAKLCNLARADDNLEATSPGFEDHGSVLRCNVGNQIA